VRAAADRARRDGSSRPDGLVVELGRIEGVFFFVCGGFLFFFLFFWVVSLFPFFLVRFFFVLLLFFGLSFLPTSIYIW